MATIRSILGDIEGSAGQITFSKQNGKNILRQKVGSNASNTPAQQNTRSRFKLLASLYKKLAPTLALGLKRQNGQSPYNRFVGLNFAATSADLQNVARVDYALLQLSGGAVEPLENFAASKFAGSNAVTATWTDNSNGAGALGADTVTVAVVNRRTGAVVAALADVTRAGETVNVTHQTLVGMDTEDLMAYGFARRADGSDASAAAAVEVV